jgi:hypothetical protein
MAVESRWLEEIEYGVTWIKGDICVRSEIFTAMNIQDAVFWSVRPCSDEV